MGLSQSETQGILVKVRKAHVAKKPPGGCILTKREPMGPGKWLVGDVANLRFDRWSDRGNFCLPFPSTRSFIPQSLYCPSKNIALTKFLFSLDIRRSPRRIRSIRRSAGGCYALLNNLEVFSSRTVLPWMDQKSSCQYVRHEWNAHETAKR